MSAVGRGADTYLLSEEEDLSPAMVQAFGAAGNGPSQLAALVQVTTAAITFPLKPNCLPLSLQRDLGTYSFDHDYHHPLTSCIHVAVK